MVVFQTLGELSNYFDDNGGGILDVVDPGYSLTEGVDILPGDVWRTQPSVRKVVSFIARGHAAVPRKVYDRVSDTERLRVTDDPLARAMKFPNPSPGMTAYQFWFDVVVDYMLYDRYCIAKAEIDGELELHRVPARKVRFKTNALDEITKVVLYIGGERQELDPARFIIGHGYSHSGANGTSPMSTLADILAEQNEAVQYRRDLWKRGARFGGVITRKTDWPNGKARRRFLRGFQKFASGGASAGSWLLLEDDMEAKAIESMKPSEALDLAGRTLSDIQVASAYHIAPELIGAREGNFSNMKAFFEALYGPALGPLITDIDQTLNAALTRTSSLYIEADVDAMLRGNFDDQLKSLQSSVGAAWLTRNEARALSNLPPIDGGDDLVVPLNVLIGGQANPRDSAPKSTALDDLVPPALVGRKAAHICVKARAPEPYTTKTEQVLTAFLDRQKNAVLSALGATDHDDWWDTDRWDSELAGDLLALAVSTSTEVAQTTLETVGFDPDEYDVDRTLPFLAAVAESRAGMINATTQERVKEAVDSEDDEAPTPADVFEDRKDADVGSSATALVTTFSSFAVAEVGHQFAPDTATKTWAIRSKRPRITHALMNGETVPISEKFSNGMDWPGDPVGGADEVSGCECEIELTFS